MYAKLGLMKLLFAAFKVMAEAAQYSLASQAYFMAFDAL